MNMWKAPLLITTFLVLVAQTSNRWIQAEESPAFPGVKQSFHGFEMYSDQKRGWKIVVPKTIAAGKPWVWRARFWGHEPQFDVEMLKRGYHVVTCNVANLFGSPKAVQRGDALYNYLVEQHAFSKLVVLEGMSRGGLFIYHWAAANPDKVSAIYGDAPVMDFKSWPGGRGRGKGSAGAWKSCLQAYGFTEQQALMYNRNPIDHLTPLARAGIPIIHVVGDQDEVVPVAENTEIAERRYKALGGRFKVIHKPSGKHHPHSLKDPDEIVTFVMNHQRKAE
ncbi:MAG: hypothetical protein CL681_20370 [Blastopirellula sp.]|nr:hypothetical protein [Blastopirellula sp.]